MRNLGLFSSVAVLVLAAGCAGGPDNDEESESDGTVVTPGEGDNAGAVSEDEIVTKNQLTGRDLPTKRLSLTFDDGPGPRTAELADWLADRGIKATFFINGMNVPGRQAAIETIVKKGHLLANHTQHHKQLTSLSAREIAEEVRETHRIIGGVQAQGPFVFRAPYGAWNASVARAINDTGLKKYVGSVFWDIGGALTTTSAADWDCWGHDMRPRKCGDLYLSEIHSRKRGIVLMHDIHSRTIDMVKYMVPKLEDEGYRFVPLTAVPSVKEALQ
jgi:peptidoglycan-N-acetylglucosamine deacetylase